MASKSQKNKGKGTTLSTLNVTIKALNLTKEISSITPARDVFSSASVLLALIRDSIANEQDYVDLGMHCADVCKALERGLDGRRQDELSRSVLEAIGYLTQTITTIQEDVTKEGKRHAVSRFFHAKDGKDKIVTWRQELNRIVQVFSAELAINTHMLVVDIHRNALRGQEGETGRDQPASVSLGELPPPPPRACFGREEVIDEVVGLGENLEPIALIGAGGIGKTSIALTVLHHDRIVERFGDDRRFVRCDQFPASRLHFLARLSKVIGARVDNPDNLTSLEPFLSSRKMLIVLDNAESILDPQGANAHEIYAIVDHLCQFRNLSICITSRITTVPRYCKCPEISTLSMEAACNIFYGIYGDRRGRSMAINDLLQRLDFHALSITLLATVGSHNGWDFDRLANEWGAHRAQVLRTDFNESLAATIELSLASPTFLKLGPEARDLLGVVTFFPHGVDEQNLDWFFPSIPDRRNIFDKFYILSLTYRSNGFVTALAPIRNYLSPRDPTSSSLLRATRDCYSTRLSINIEPDAPGYGQARWIMSEDVNVEHLLNIFTSIDADSGAIWDACCNFMMHLYRHKPRQTLLGPKIEALPDGHRSKPSCLSRLSLLFLAVGKYEEQRRLLTAALEIGRDRGDDFFVAETLRFLSQSNRMLKHYEEGILRAKEASEVYERLSERGEEARCLRDLAELLLDNQQLDAAEDAASRSIDLVSGKDEEFLVCQSHQILGNACRLKGKNQEAIQNFQKALDLASSHKWHGQLVSTHYSLALLFKGEREFDSANAHIEQAKLYVVDHQYNLGSVMTLQAVVWCEQGRFEDAKLEASSALEILRKLGATKGVEGCTDILQWIEKVMGNQSICA